MGYPHGMFSWADLSSVDQEKAEDFYSELFGWAARREEIPDNGYYVMFSKDGKDVAGLGEAQSGMPSVWQAYVSVDDVDAVAAKVSSAGGQVIAGPFDVMESGRMAVFADPTGAVLSAWQARSHPGAGNIGDEGFFVWAELATRGLEDARPFYEQVFDWTWTSVPMPHMEYWLASYRGQDPEEGGTGGAMEINESFPPEVPPHWAVYFSVDDVDSYVTRATAIGGSIHVPPTDIPSVGRFSLLMDPTGATFYVLSSEGA